jgi:hypothetical protein
MLSGSGEWHIWKKGGRPGEPEQEEEEEEEKKKPLPTSDE